MGYGGIGNRVEVGSVVSWGVRLLVISIGGVISSYCCASCPFSPFFFLSPLVLGPVKMELGVV